MNKDEIKNPLLRQAVDAMDTGDLTALEKLLHEHPSLVNERLNIPTDGYFKEPYLLWFIADNPIRNEKLPENILAITKLLIKTLEANSANTKSDQLNYTLGLVATGRIPRESGRQIQLMDLLIDAGATPGKGAGAIAHGNFDAARHLIKRGGRLTLAVAVCLDMTAEIQQLLPQSSAAERQQAFVAAAFYGKVEMMKMLMQSGVDINGYLEKGNGFHEHATALHQAVWSQSLEAVKLLVEAGARLDLPDKIYQGTPLGWAIYMQTENPGEEEKKKIAAIEKYLRGKSN